jgi:hypothetical protein
MLCLAPAVNTDIAPPLAGRPYAGVAKLVDAPDLGSGIVRCGGSSPFARTSLRSLVNVRKTFAARRLYSESDGVASTQSELKKSHADCRNAE